jgi:hypothetical protein
MTKTKSKIRRTPLVPERVRSIGSDGFSFFPNQFLRGGFFAALSPEEILLYFLLVLAGDRNGVSFYHNDTLCDLLSLPIDSFIATRNQLIRKDLIAYDGVRFQVLELPPMPPPPPDPLCTPEDLERDDPATIRRLIQRSLGERGNG